MPHHDEKCDAGEQPVFGLSRKAGEGGSGEREDGRKKADAGQSGRRRLPSASPQHGYGAPAQSPCARTSCATRSSDRRAETAADASRSGERCVDEGGWEERGVQGRRTHKYERGKEE